MSAIEHCISQVLTVMLHQAEERGEDDVAREVLDDHAPVAHVVAKKLVVLRDAGNFSSADLRAQFCHCGADRRDEDDRFSGALVDGLCLRAGERQ